MSDFKRVTIYTDGACVGNPGPGGYGVVLLYGKHRKELSGGFRKTTNNRMEIMGAIVGLKALKGKCAVTLHTDSQYLVNTMMKGWARRWKSYGWKRNRRAKARNADLLEELLDLCAQHEVNFVWVKGHAGIRENERCDRLAEKAARQRNLPVDEGFEKSSAISTDNVSDDSEFLMPPI